MSYDHQNFFGITLNDLEGRHVFVFLILCLKNFFLTFLQPLYDFWNQESTGFYRDLTTGDFQNVNFLCDFFFFSFFQFYVCYRSNFFITVKYKFPEVFQVHFMCWHMIYFHWREIKNQNVSQELIQNPEISTQKRVIWDLT